MEPTEVREPCSKTCSIDSASERKITNVSNARHEITSEWQELQQLHSALDRAQQEVMSLDQKLCQARRNLEEEKRKRRIAEQERDLLKGQINTIRDILFHNEEVSLDEGIKKKLHFLSKPVVIKDKHNVYNQDTQNDGQLSTIMEMDSTGSILSDLNCLSKSEDDLDTNGVLLQNKKYREWKEYGAENLVYTHHSTLDKVAKFNSLDRATIATVKAYDSAHTASAQTQVTPSENIVSNASETTVYANHSFVSKMVIKPETCTSCGKRIRFGKIMLKCRDCPIVCHVECKTTIRKASRTNLAENIG